MGRLRPTLSLFATSLLAGLFLGRFVGLELFCSAAVLALACGARQVSILLVFALAGALATRTPDPLSPDPAPRIVDVVASVARSSQRLGPDEQRTWVEDVRSTCGEERFSDGWLSEASGASNARAAGQTLEIRAVYVPGSAPRNPAQPPRAARYEVVLPEHVQVVADQPTPWQALRRRLDELAARRMAELSSWLDAAALELIGALFLGRADALSPDLRRQLQDTGLYHFFAVSGLHVGLCGAFAWWILRRIGSRSLRLALLVLALLAYVALTGARPPAIRAFGLFLAFAWRRHRRSVGSSLPACAAVFLGLIVVQPSVETELGFKLSFAAVLGIHLSQVYSSAPSPRGTGSGIQWFRWCRQGFAISVAATLATAPLLILGTGAWSPTSMVASVLLGPLIAPLWASCALTFLLGDGWPLLLPLCSELLSGAMRGLSATVAWLDGFSFTPWWSRMPTAFELFLFGAVAALLGARKPRVAVVTALALAATALATSPGQGGPSLTLLDTGHGQCAIFRSGARVDLWDAGSLADSSDLRALRRTLAWLRVSRLDALVLSHLDRDHAAHGARLLDQLPVGELLLPSSCQPRGPGGTGEPDPAAELLEVARRRGVPVRFLAAGDEHGPYRVLWPPAGRRFLERNDGSLAVLVSLGESRLLWPGDLSGFPLLEMAARAGSAEYLLLPHHGNEDPATADLLGRVRPTLALASRSGPLPSATRKLLEGEGVRWHSTHQLGAFLLEPTGRALALTPGRASATRDGLAAREP